MAMIRFYIILLPVILVTFSCKNEGRVPKPENYVNPDQMAEILTNLYMADGLLNNPQVRKRFEYKDSTQNYIDIIESYGYNKDEFDASVSYLFLTNPQKLEAVYERVLANLSKIEADNLKDKEITAAINRDYYNGRSSISLPDFGITDRINLDVPIDKPGEYIVRVRILIYEDDQSINPFINLNYWYDDGTENGHSEPWDTIWLNKTGRSELITLSKIMADSSATHIRGPLFNHTDQSGHWEKHAQYSNFNITHNDREEIIKGPQP